MKNVVRVAMGTRKNKRHKKNGYAPVPATTEFVHLNIRGGPMKEIEQKAKEFSERHRISDAHGERIRVDVLELLHQTRLEALEEGRREGDKFFFIREKSLKNRLQLMGEKVKELQNAKNNICK